MPTRKRTSGGMFGRVNEFKDYATNERDFQRGWEGKNDKDGKPYTFVPTTYWPGSTNKFFGSMDPIPNYFIVINGKLKKRSDLGNLASNMPDIPALSRTALDREEALAYFNYLGKTPTKDELKNKMWKIFHAREKVKKQTQKNGGDKRKRTKKYRR